MWSRKADLRMPANRGYAASVVHDGKIYVMGGRVAGEGASASVITYDTEADAWETAPALPEPGCDGCAATVDGHIFIVANHHRFEYRNPAWSQALGGPSSRYPVCGSFLLG